MSTPDQQRTLVRMRAVVEEMIAAAGADGGRVGFAVDATRMARGPGGCLYRVDPPADVRLVEDAPIRLSAGQRATGGRLGPVADGSCVLETDLDLGPRVLRGRLLVDNLAPLRGLLDRLDALAGNTPEPPAYRFDQAELVLGAPGGRLRDRIASAAESTSGWRLDDRAGDLLSSALRQRWAAVQSPPGADTGALLARLLDRLVELDARVLFVATAGNAVDRTVGALCDRLARAGRLRSGLVQRVGPLAPGAVRDRWGPYVDAKVIAADLRARLASRLAELDRLEGRLRFDEAELRADELGRDAAQIDDLLERTVGARLGRRQRGLDPDALLVRQHELRAQQRTARRTAERIALELAGDGPVPHAEEVLGAGDRTPAERMEQLAQARKELVSGRADIAQALRRHCRVVATTTRSAYLRRLPRTDFDVVVLAGPASLPEAYYLAGLSTRSVVSVGDAGGAPDRPADGARRVPAHHPDPVGRRRRPSLLRPVRPRRPGR
ncbi:MAG: hypothetical protein ACJ73E_02745 [Mycobacteriales bacterium]